MLQNPSLDATPEGSALAEDLPPERANALVRALLGLAGALARPAEVSGFFRIATTEALRLVDAGGCILCIPEPDDESVLRVWTGAGILASEENELLPVEGSLAGAAIVSDRARMSLSLSSDGSEYWNRECKVRVGPALAVAIVGKGRICGSLLVAREPDASGFDSRDAAVLELFARQVGLGLETLHQHEISRDPKARIEAWRRERGLLRWKGQYDTAAAHYRSAVFQWDRESDRLFWSDSVQSVFGGLAPHFAESLAQWATHFDVNDRETLLSGLSRVAGSGGEVQIEGTLGHPNGGDPLPVRVTARVDDATGLVWGTVQRLDLTADEGERISSRLVKGLRHEINNPLSAVIGLAQLLHREEALADNPMLKQAAEVIWTEGKRVANVLKRLERAQQTSGVVRYNPMGGFDLPE